MGRKLGFYLMNRKGAQTLQALLQHVPAASLAFVVSAPDPGVDADYFEEIQALCNRSSVPFYDRTSVPPAAAHYRFAIGWRWMLPEPERLIILHDSLLPRYRGFAPLVNALINGEKELGVTALFAGASYDTGPIIEQRSFEVQYPIKVAEAIEAMAVLYGELVVDLATTLLGGGLLRASPQDEAAASYSLWRDEEDYWIDWHLSAEAIRRTIDALGFPYRGASARAGEQKCRILEAEEVADVRIENRHPGKVLFVVDGCPVVVCGEGLLRLTRVIDEASGEEMLPLRRFRTRFH